MPILRSTRFEGIIRLKEMISNTITGTTLRAKRVAAGIAGQVVCTKLAFARSKLTAIERGYTFATPDELARIDAVLDDLIRAKGVLRQTAAALGWPLSEVP
jgi:hypothetical protein